MSVDSEDLEYLTVDSIQWSAGYVRPRMSREDKRAKHRIHQRNFVLRQRERLDDLRRELRRHELQFLQFQAAKEIAALTTENDSLRLQLETEALPMGPSTMPVLPDLSPIELKNLPESSISSPSELGRVWVGDNNSFIFESLTLLPELKTEDVMFVNSCWSPTCDTEVPIPLPSSPTSPGGLTKV